MGTDHTTSGTPDDPGRLAGGLAWTEGEPHLDHHLEELLVALSDLARHGADGQSGAAGLPPPAA